MDNKILDITIARLGTVPLMPAYTTVTQNDAISPQLTQRLHHQLPLGLPVPPVTIGTAPPVTIGTAPPVTIGTAPPATIGTAPPAFFIFSQEFLVCPVFFLGKKRSPIREFSTPIVDLESLDSLLSGMSLFRHSVQ
jgi:hypothetical protein